MNNIYTETKTTSYGTNIKNSFAKVVFGLILFIVSFFILWGNERRNVNQINLANYVEKNAIPVASDTVNRINDNKLISIASEAITDESLSDGIVVAENALVLERKVEMYQWIEESETSSTDNFGGSTTETTTYDYQKQWTDQEVNSQRFHQSGYTNPPFSIKSQHYYASTGQLGAFRLTTRQTSEISNLVAFSNLPANEKYKIIDGYYYEGDDYQNPQIGDIRISYTYAPSGTKISVIGEQKSDDSIVPMISEKGSIYIQYDGLLTQDEMLKKFRHINSLFTWVFRLVGLLLMFVGLKIIVNPLIVIAKFIPPLASLVSFISSTVIFLISLILSMITIGIAWFAYRPLMSILLFGLVVMIIFFAKAIHQKRQ